MGIVNCCAAPRRVAVRGDAPRSEAQRGEAGQPGLTTLAGH